MGIENLQSWADNLETVRIPRIETDIAQLTADQAATQGQLSAKVQEFTDSFATHAARITANQAGVTTARGEADFALGRIYQGDLEVRAYIDQRIQELRAEMGAGFGGLEAYLDGGFRDGISQDTAAHTAALIAAVNQSVAIVQAAHAEALAEVEDIRSVSGEILDSVLPGQENRLEGYEATVNGLKSEVDQVLAGFDYDSLVDGINDLQARVSDSLAPLGVTVPRAPASAWTTEAETGTEPKAPLTSDALLRDAVLGECARLPLGSDATLGQSYPVDFDPTHVYRVRVRVRATNSGSTGGVHLALGVTTWTGEVATEVEAEKVVTETGLTGGDLDQVFTCLFSASLPKLEAQDYAIGTAATDEAFHLPGSGSANRAYFYVKQNPDGLSNGQVLVGVLEVKDVTEALDAAQIVRTQIEAKLGDFSNAGIEELQLAIADVDSALGLLRQDVTAGFENTDTILSTQYYTIAQADQAIVGYINDLKSQIEDPAGSSVGARLTTEHYTRTQTDQAISSATTTIQSVLNTLTIPKDFTQDGAFWSHSITGDPVSKPSLSSPVEFVSDGSMGRVARLAGPQSGNRHFVPKVYVPNTAGVRYRAVIVARHNGAFFGNSFQALRFLVRKIGGSYNAGGDIFSTILAFTAADTVKTFTVEWTCDGTSAYFAPFCYITTELASGTSIDIQSVDVDNVSAAADLGALITQNYLTKTDATQAIATGISNYDASVPGGVKAKVSSHETAIASLNGFAQSMVGFKVKAGNQVSLLDLIAYDGSAGGGPSYSLARISAQDILLNGTVTMNMLVITDTSGNLVQNGAMPFGDARGWGNMPSTLKIVARLPASPYGPVRTAPTSYMLQLDPNTSPAYVEIGSFDCVEGDRFSTQYHAAAAVATGCHIGIQFVWFYADGGQITATARTTVIDYSGWKSIVTPPVAAPAGAARCVMRAIRWGDNLSSIGLLTNLEVMRQRSGGTVLTPKSVTTDHMDVGTLSAITATIGILRTATSGARMEIHTDKILVYDATNTVRVRIGNLS